MAYPPYTATEARTRETFLALMWALSYPGRAHYLPLPGSAFPLIGEALLDLETSYYTPDSGLSSVLARTGAKALPVDEAAYQFYPTLDTAALAGLREVSIGAALYPDRAATLMIACTLGSGPTYSFQGPGVKDSLCVEIGGLPDSFWTLRESACRFPLGWDVYLIDGSQMIGLPRTTRIQRL